MQNLLPGETLTTMPNGNLLLTMRNGNTHEFTPEEWDDYSATFKETLPMSEMIDMILDSIKGRQIVEVSEMIDSLLDLRLRATSAEEGMRRAVEVWSAAVRKLDYWEEIYEETGLLPEPREVPEGFRPKWMDDPELGVLS